MPNNAVTRNETFNPTRFEFARHRRGYTQMGLAKKLNIDVRTVTAYESGEYPPSLEVLDLMTFVLDFPAEFFFGDNLEHLFPKTLGEHPKPAIRDHLKSGQ